MRITMADMICIKIYQTRQEAGLAKSVLEANGIPAFVTADDYGGWLPFRLGGMPVRLLVSETDADDALDILRQYYQQRVTENRRGQNSIC